MDLKSQCLSEELIDFLNEKFPATSNDLKESLELFESVIQNAIDLIEEKSSDLVKKERNFYEANNYRVKANELFGISIGLQDIIFKLDFEGQDTSQLRDQNQRRSIDEKSIPNYNQYLVDDKIQHTLYEDFTHKRPAAFELKGKKYLIKDWKEMLLETCNFLAEIDKEVIKKFPGDPKMNGKKVTYFAFKETDILRAPRKLRDYDIYVATNHSANSIRNIIINVLRAYKLQPHEFKIYLKADYSELHE